MFQTATKKNISLRLALTGPSGSGKTFTALSIATGLGEGRFAVLDTEHGASELYADAFDFDIVKLTSFEPEQYIEVIQAAQAQGYHTLVIDSLSHAWAGKGGLLEAADAMESQNNTKGFSKWRHITPRHQRLVETVLQADLHIIATMRSKTAWTMEKKVVNGRETTAPVKVGMDYVQRPGIEYEFSVVGEMNPEHRLTITKTHLPTLDGQSYAIPGPELGMFIRGELGNPTQDALGRVRLLNELKAIIDDRGLDAVWQKHKAEAGGKFTNEELQAIIDKFTAMAPDRDRDAGQTLVDVLSSKGDQTYQVDVQNKTCTCKGFQFNHTCKHIDIAMGVALKAAQNDEIESSDLFGDDREELTTREHGQKEDISQTRANVRAMLEAAGRPQEELDALEDIHDAVELFELAKAAQVERA